MKVQRSITIDYEVQAKLQENPHINASAVVNQFLRKYLGLDKDERQ